MMKLKAIDITVFITLIVCIVATVSFENQCEGIREEVLRLHIIANSDEDYDQELKLKVRNALLVSGEEVFSGSEDIISAENKIANKTDILKNIAEETIKDLNFDYNVSIELTKSYFPTRTYGELTLPAGYYKAVRVIIGEGKGKNWWCIMFPPLCLPAATDSKELLSNFLSEQEMRLVSCDPKFEVRFWLIEKYYELKNSLFVKD
jgi:stage II sporulation protein R